MVVGSEAGQQGAVLKDPQAELAKIHGREIWIQWTDEVLVEPLCFLDLETYSLDRLELFFW